MTTGPGENTQAVPAGRLSVQFSVTVLSNGPEALTLNVAGVDVPPFVTVIVTGDALLNPKSITFNVSAAS